MPAAVLPTAPPGAAELRDLDPDLWQAVVLHLRRTLSDLPAAEQTPQVRRLVALPTRRLVVGRARRDAADLIATGGVLWLDLRRRMQADRDLAARLADALTRRPATTPPPAKQASEPTPATEPGEVARLRTRLRDARRDRDQARRRADGEAARADREAADAAAARSRVEELEAQLVILQDQVAAAEADRAQAVEREHRRAAAEQAALQAQLTDLRRQLADQARKDRAVERAREVAAEQAAAAVAASDAPPPEVLPGRPSVLPERVVAGTTEAVAVLLHAGREVIIDGYNVTRTHRADLDLEGQRRWLVNLVAAAAAARRIVPTIVFDGHGTPGEGSSRRHRGVLVEFTREMVTADDSIVFAVAATDPGTPLVVVTDDRELRDRLASYRVDLVPTKGFVDALR